MGEEFKGIFITEHQMSNMKMERIVVSNEAILVILKTVALSQEEQVEAVDMLVSRTPEWLDIENDIQMDKIKAVLTQESVIKHLKNEGIIRKNCDMVQTGIDAEGSIVVEAYYTAVNREQRRMIEKTLDAKKKQDMAQAINIMSSNDNLIDLAAAKLKRLQQTGKVKPAKKKK